MSRSNWLREFIRQWWPTIKRRAPARRPRTSRIRPWMERLEDRVAPTISLSIAPPAPFPEGDSGTSNMLFVVTRSGDLSPAFSVSYTTQDGTAVAGTDYVATAGSVSFLANQTTASIAVPVIGNTVL